MTAETVSRSAFDSLSRIQRAVLLLLESEGKVVIQAETEPEAAK